ncbi:hypothetical protein QYE76_049412 [Lolium multiflorum]|uniref:Reverse transcriptase/retrotransposon-derived protein RNase H-like domain-containing protein n=1 Tax=Lolium multiflorum TaxID=4521 RepID=A0AAD8WIC0_LOLMU|nr:hypothetical protein QYE76_049412 [Lolium multiflorum]
MMQMLQMMMADREAERAERQANIAALQQIAQNNQGHGNHDLPGSKLKNFQNTNPPMFSKTEEPLDADDWLQTMENNLEVARVEAAEKSCLPPTTCRDLPEPGGLVRPDETDNEKKKERFLNGLHDEMQTVLVNIPFADLEALVDSAIQMEGKLHQANENRKRRMMNQSGPSNTSRFVEGFSSIARPMTQLLKKDKKFEWTDKCEESFQKLKSRLTTAPILIMPDITKPFDVYCDASKIGLGCVLMQEGKVISYLSQAA